MLRTKRGLARHAALVVVVLRLRARDGGRGEERVEEELVLEHVSVRDDHERLNFVIEWRPHRVLAVGDGGAQHGVDGLGLRRSRGAAARVARASLRGVRARRAAEA